MDNNNYINNNNPFLINISDNDLANKEYMLSIQSLLNQKNVNYIIDDYYSRHKNKMYTITDFKYRCNRGFSQKIIDIENKLLPSFKLYQCGDNPSKKNCFVNCTSYLNNNNHGNSRYLSSNSLYKCLQSSGFNGYFYQLHGGFPNPTGKEFKYAGVPYSFKIFMMLEAYNKGFTNVIWIDAACCAINNPSYLFECLEKDKVLLEIKPPGNYGAMVFKETKDILDKLTNSDLNNARYIQSTIFGLKLDTDIIKQFIFEYYKMVDLGLPFLSIFPEEIVFSALFNKKEFKHLIMECTKIPNLYVYSKNYKIDDPYLIEKNVYFYHNGYNNLNNKSNMVNKNLPVANNFNGDDNSNIFPFSFSIPDECLIGFNPVKKRLLAPLIPGQSSTYSFNQQQESEYYQMYQESRFAITKMKGGWDCLRHYEILMNKCIPLFENLNDCPLYTLTTYPKHLNDKAYSLYNSWQDTPENIQKYNSLLEKYINHTREYCTTTQCCRYFLSHMINHKSIKKILLLTCHEGINYNRESLWIGLKRYIQKINGVAVEYPPMPFLYKDYDGSNCQRYYSHICFTIPKRLEKDQYYGMEEKEICEKIQNKFWDIIIYGKVGPDEYCKFPFINMVEKIYNPNEIAFIFGGDEIFDLTVTDKNKYHKNMFNRNIYYYPYNEYLNNLKHKGKCFVRELNMN
jgi:hypothetical protein